MTKKKVKKVLIFFRFFRVLMIKYNKINRKESILWKKSKYR